MSADKDSGAPYYSINYSKSKDGTVTAGKKDLKHSFTTNFLHRK